MNIVNLLISLISGAVGGNAAGAAMKDKSLGTAGNSISGILGGGLGGMILQMLGIGSAAAGTAASSGSLDIKSILASIASGGVGGGVLMAIISAVKNAMMKKA